MSQTHDDAVTVEALTQIQSEKDTTAPAIEVEADQDGNTHVVAVPLEGEQVLLSVKEGEDDITLKSDISRPNRRIWVVTTAGLPWRTGTGLNPLMRALQLTEGRPKGYVTLMIPWIESESTRAMLYGEENKCQSKEEQEEWIRDYCRRRCGSTAKEEKSLRIRFWTGQYHGGLGSIFPTEDICSLIPKDEADVAILEEPEHLNWFRYPKGKDEVDTLGWRVKFNHVVGILHTNYDAYVKSYGWGTLATAPALQALSTMVVRAYCHRVIRLSATLPSLDPRLEVTSNVHGVRPEFLEKPEPKDVEDKCHAIYFVGKLIWAKGFDYILEVQERFKDATGEYFPIDIYGSGSDVEPIKRAFFGRCGEPEERPTSPFSDNEDGCRATDVLDGAGESSKKTEEESKERNAPLEILGDISDSTLKTGAETAGAAYRLVESLMQAGMGKFTGKSDRKRPHKEFFGPVRSRFKWRKIPLPARFLGVKDHAEIRDIPEQRIFLNMSTTEVLCTTSAEALAMGKFVILPRHPSNEFFYEFPNCLAYESYEDCVDKIKYALENKPEPLNDEYAFKLSWKGATERLYKAAGITMHEATAAKVLQMEESSMKAVRFHVESAKKSMYLTQLFTGQKMENTTSADAVGATASI